jgi:ribosomal protein S18 acetylase RimI-like enzyme
MPPPAMLPTIEAGSVQLRIAQPSDASEIFALASRVFGSKQFLYTVYQAPQSLRYVERLITDSDASHRFVLLKRDLELLGYYEALIRDGSYFLNYIATDSTVSGQGFGKLLLRDFEAMGRNSGCQQLALDVFQSNARAVAWYQHRGFREKSMTYLARIALRDVPTNSDDGLRIDEEEIHRSLAEERDWGFSKVKWQCDSGSGWLGLIGGRNCKLLDLNGITLAQAVNTLAANLSDQREVLIVSSSEPINFFKHEVMSSESVLRMVKPIA